MEEYYILLNLENEEDEHIHLWHEKLYSQEEIKNIIKGIHQECKMNEPKVLEQHIFIYYLQYRLINDYAFVPYQRKNIYTYEQTDIFE